MSNANRFLVDSNMLGGEFRAVPEPPYLNGRISPSTPMKSSFPSKSPLLSRCCVPLFLFLALFLFPLNFLRAQSPMPDDFNPGPDEAVSAIAVQSDGKILVGGTFRTLNGQPRDCVGRLNPDGSLDSTFNPGASWAVNCMVVQTDGKILVGGELTDLGGQPRRNIGRLNFDGTLDTSFNPGANDWVATMTLQLDGKILVAGGFTELGSQPRSYIGRLNMDGTLDNVFSPSANGQINSIAVQADGKILVGGEFTILAGQPRNFIGRLNTNGTLDDAFNPEANAAVTSMALQADGKILLGGDFTSLAGQRRDYIGRLNSSGTLDTTFNSGNSGDGLPLILSLAVQSDGKILVGGFFTTLGGQSRNNIGRLNINGTVDNTFNPGANSDVVSLAVQADGKILAGGYFATLGGQSRPNIGRLNNNFPATQSLRYGASTITWLRGGASPEVGRTTFEHSTNGVAWRLLGIGTRILGGWQLTGLSLPPYGVLRARGNVAGGFRNGSVGIVETILDLTIHLRLIRNDSTALLSWTGGQGPYQVQQTTDASQADSWRDVGAPMQTNSISLPIGPGTVFLRVRGQ